MRTIKTGIVEVKKAAVQVYCYHKLENYMVSAVLIRHNKDYGRIELRSADGKLHSLFSQGTNWSYIRKLWKTLKTQENRLVMPK